MSVNVSKDSRGFDDIDKFWSAVDAQIRESDESSGDEFEYDTSSTISESLDEGSEDEESRNQSISVVTDKSPQSNISVSLSLHENDDEDTDAQGGSDDESLERNESKAESAMKKDLSRSTLQDKSRRQSRVQFEDDVSSKQLRRQSAPGALSTSSRTTTAKKEKKKEEQLIDESSPFIVAGRISEIPAVDESQSFQHEVYDDNDVPFGDDSSLEESIKSIEQTPSVGSTAEKSKFTTSDTLSSNKKIRKRSKYEYYDTPGTTPSSEQSTPGQHVHGRKLPDDSYHSSEDDEDDNDEGMTDHGADTTDHSFVDTSYMQAVRAGTIEGNSESEPEADDGGPRRSRRATKGLRLQFWKNERPEYRDGKMVGYLQAKPTPAKPSMKQRQSKKKKSKGKTEKRLFDDEDSSNDGSDDGESRRRKKSRKTFPASNLPRDVKFVPRANVDSIAVWDDVVAAPVSNAKVIHLQDAAYPPAKLPITALRPEGKDVVGVAAQSFNVPEIPKRMSAWISGFCELPPGGIKDAEGVGECCQVFQVASCQDGSLELGLAHPSEEEWVDDLAQRIVLKSRDSFYVPPGNIYRLENHSRSEPCVIYWTIIRPLDEPDDDDENPANTVD